MGKIGVDAGVFELPVSIQVEGEREGQMACRWPPHSRDLKILGKCVETDF